MIVGRHCKSGPRSGRASGHNVGNHASILVGEALVSFGGRPSGLSMSDKSKQEGIKNMLVKALRFVSLLCAAVALGLTLTHDLEIPGKHSLDGPEWRNVRHTFYGGFAIVGGIAEVLGLTSTGVLLVLRGGNELPSS
jgi:hypothetical protein